MGCSSLHIGITQDTRTSLQGNLFSENKTIDLFQYDIHGSCEFITVHHMFRILIVSRLMFDKFPFFIKTLITVGACKPVLTSMN